MISLYEDQERLLEKCRDVMRKGIRRYIIQGSTGFGKTRVACRIIESVLQKGKSVVILCNRDKLLKQWHDVLNNFEIQHGIIQYGTEPNDEAVQIASVDSYITRLDKKFDVCIADEMHYANGYNFKTCIQYQEAELSIGMSATPIAPNGAGFADLYDEIVQADGMEWLIKNGRLSPLHIYSASPPDIDLEITDGDFNMAQYMRKCGGVQRINNAIELYKKHINGKLTIVFAVNISDAKNITKQFNDSGISAKCIHSKLAQKTQDKILEDFKNKGFLVLVSVSILNEGIDVPQIEAGIDMSPTASLTRYLQRWGRCIRTCEGKTHATMLDLSGNYWLHNEPWYPHQWSLSGRSVSKQSVMEAILSVRICMSCGRNYNSALDSCPHCNEPVKRSKRVIKEASGKLILVTSDEYDRIEKEKADKIQAKIDRKEELKRRRKEAKTFEAYEQIERDFGYSKGWGYLNYSFYLKARQKYFRK